MLKLTRAIVRGPNCSIGRFNNKVIHFSASTSAEVKTNNQIEHDVATTLKSNKPINPKNPRSSNIVAAAFASLNSETNSSDIKTPFTDKRIDNANTVNDILSISEGTGVSRRHSLKVVSVLADWSSSGRIKLADFESDPRFIKLCKVLTKGTLITKYNRNSTVSRSDDLSTIMSVTADDEAAKLVASITIPQMIKVMQTLATKKRRSTMLLRSISFNITRSKERLDLKQAADLLYSVAILNFPDDNLLERIGNDIVASLNDSLKKSAVIGSILTSLGLLRYKDDVGIVDAVCAWTLKHYEICRPQDIFALFQTLAVLNFEPANARKLYETLIPQLSYSDTNKPGLWLDFVWSLVLLNESKPEHISSVLSEKFLIEIEGENPLSVSSKLKLLNINAASNSLLTSYNGPKLNNTDALLNTPLARTKEKEQLVTSMLEALKNLMPSEKFINTNVNSDMGFYIDAVCIFDKKCTPVTISNYNFLEHSKVAIIVQDYHEMCRGRIQPTGINVFKTKLLEANNYKILHIPFYEYDPRDKLVQRVQYLETKLKSLVHC